MPQHKSDKDREKLAIRKHWAGSLNFAAGILWFAEGFVSIGVGESGGTGFALSAVFFSLSVLWWGLAAKDRQGEAPRD